MNLQAQINQMESRSQGTQGHYKETAFNLLTRKSNL